VNALYVEKKQVNQTQTTNYSQSNPSSIKELFKTIATHYDTGNAILSFNMHKNWNDHLVESALSSPLKEPLLDLCAGTGAIAYAYLKKKNSPSQVILLDFCQEMLNEAKKKLTPCSLKNHLIDYLCADAQEIPLKDASVGAITMAYGIRNIKDKRKALKEAYRVLKTGGQISILELTRPKNRLLAQGHKLYLKTCVPLLGKLITNNKNAYEYLCQSIKEFVSQEDMVSFFQETGFKRVQCKTLSFGIATLFTAKKL
jgi:demethylmenaquinone methyltransferase / 2-methoxy-6-polyprenyl-1,4-benzoquinol methylase